MVSFNTFKYFRFAIEQQDDILDIDYILNCLSKIKASDLYSTTHFEVRIRQRKNNILSDVNSIYSIILKDKPVEISKQDETKFKLKYNIDTDYDLTIVISSRTLNPISFNLVTCIIENSDKRLREDK